MNQALDIIKTEFIADGSGGSKQLDLPQDAKQRIMGFLQEIKEDSPKNWASINTISQASNVSSMYTRHVLKKLCDDGIVETGWLSSNPKKFFFRLRP